MNSSEKRYDTDENNSPDKITVLFSFFFETVFYGSFTVLLTNLIISGEVRTLGQHGTVDFSIGILLALGLTFLSRSFRKTISEVNRSSESSKNKGKISLLLIRFLQLISSFAAAVAIVKDANKNSPLEDHLIALFFWFILLLIFSNILVNLDIKRRIDAKETKKQNKIINTQKKEISKKEAQKTDAIEGIKHELGNTLPPTLHAIRKIKKIIKDTTSENKELDVLIDDLESKIKDSIITVKNIDEIIEGISSELSAQQLFPLVEKYIKEHYKLFADSVIRITHLKPDQESMILLDEEKITKLLGLLFNNMIMHSFIDTERKDYKVLIAYKVNTDNVKMIIATNGEPFMVNNKEFVTKNAKAGPTGNTGFGGFMIKQILDAHSASIDIETKQSDYLKELADDYAEMSDFRTLTFPKVSYENNAVDKSTSH